MNSYVSGFKAAAQRAKEKEKKTFFLFFFEDKSEASESRTGSERLWVKRSAAATSQLV